MSDRKAEAYGSCRMFIAIKSMTCTLCVWELLPPNGPLGRAGHDKQSAVPLEAIAIAQELHQHLPASKHCPKRARPLLRTTSAPVTATRHAAKTQELPRERCWPARPRPWPIELASTTPPPTCAARGVCEAARRHEDRGDPEPNDEGGGPPLRNPRSKGGQLLPEQRHKWRVVLEAATTLERSPADMGDHPERRGGPTIERPSRRDAASRAHSTRHNAPARRNGVRRRQARGEDMSSAPHWQARLHARSTSSTALPT